MVIDFCEPITLSSYTAQKIKENENFDPFKNKKDQLSLNRDLAFEITYTLQNNLRMMPTNMVAAIVLLYRKGISHQELA